MFNTGMLTRVSTFGLCAVLCYLFLSLCKLDPDHDTVYLVIALVLLAAVLYTAGRFFCIDFAAAFS